MKGLNLAGFKKLKEDKKTVTMGHPSGHSITILKSQVSSLQKKQLEKLPLHLAEGDPNVQAPPAMPEPSEVPDEGTPQAPAIRPAIASVGNILKAALTADDDQPVQRSDSNASQYGTPASVASSPQPPPAMSGDAVNEALTSTATKPAPAAPKAPEAPKGDTATPVAKTAGSGFDNISIGDAYSKELSGIQLNSRAQQTLAESQAQAEKQHQLDLQTAQDNWAKTNASFQQNITGALNDIKNGHIDPSHYLENMGTPQKIATAIGLLAGGFTGGFNHSGVNPAAEWLNGQINRDVESQKANLNNKMNVYNAYLDQYKNAAVADQMARATQVSIYASKLREASAKAGSPIAQANQQMAAAQLEQKILPLVNNAHLIQQISPFTGAGGDRAPSGSEAQYKVALQAAQTINPELYKDQQSKYVPSVGVASHPIAQVDAERITNLNALLPLIDQALADQKKYGMTGATLSLHPTKNRADAEADREALNVSLNRLTGNNRLNDTVYQNYGKQIGDIGGLNLGGTQETLVRLKEQAIMDRNSAISSAGIKPFANADAPSGLTPPQQQNLDIFLRNNPRVDQGTAINVLREKGLI